MPQVSSIRVEGTLQREDGGFNGAAVLPLMAVPADVLDRSYR